MRLVKFTIMLTWLVRIGPFGHCVMGGLCLHHDGESGCVWFAVAPSLLEEFKAGGEDVVWQKLGSV